MAEQPEWKIIIYRTEDGKRPVREFLESLDEKTRIRFAWSIEQLRVQNIHAHPPLVKHLEGKIWELREESQTNIYRILYCFYTGRRIVFLHGFQKKTQKTPRRELGIALKRLEDFVKRKGGMAE